jgi:oxygen-independent coproporphyrinogen-3 oxidase
MKHAGIYIHIPFCRSRCSYCDFATGMYESALAARYVEAVAREIREWNEVPNAAAVDTIYFGGGTPSLLSSAQVEQILLAVRDRFNVLGGAEVTMEINPGTTTVQSPKSKVQGPGSQVPGSKFQVRSSKYKTQNRQDDVLEESAPDTLSAYRRLGVNRASFGAQTFADEQLRRLGRTHSAEDIRQTFRHLRAAGFENISFDLIAGLPGQTLSNWDSNLDEGLSLRPEHLSLYLLDLHEGTPLADQIRRGLQPAPDDDLAAEMFRLMVDKVCAAGYVHYEISNFCLPGYESRHNSKYWTGAPYYGVGCSAHSYDGAFRRWSNERDAAGYAERVQRGESPIVERVQLNEHDTKAEAIFLGMRMMRGVDTRQYRELFGADLNAEHRADLVRLSEAGLIEIEGDLIRLTENGALLSNEVFAAFV